MGNIAAFLLALAIVALVVEMLRRKKLREKYAVLWLVVGVATLVLAAFPRLLNIVAEYVGVQIPSNLLFAMSILMLLGVCLHLSWEISVVEDETRTLAEEVAILRTQLESLEQHRHLSVLDSARPAPLPNPRTASQPGPVPAPRPEAAAPAPAGAHTIDRPAESTES
ncbi:DUF2304 domain-containing protein [Arthrobacter sp. NicSoilB8]|uniref:DUF2304 domain-containing protein n=1 Tax=Arthrobacter sp. NicSoilB8 TaxID=2830998 RepID=UPI001CC544D1|nr:DUF2304 domain-containing protein [Arthrobacter sp. NicSoilB8]BCW72058.1 hypothetical protein NicSoilB8_31020 [Arthrobacter sp. NicSoilB8]